MSGPASGPASAGPASGPASGMGLMPPSGGGDTPPSGPPFPVPESGAGAVWLPLEQPTTTNAATNTAPNLPMPASPHLSERPSMRLLGQTIALLAGRQRREAEFRD